MTFTKSSLFFVATLASASVILPACSSDQAAVTESGSVGLNLTADGLVIDSVSYEVSHADGISIPGTINVSEKDAAGIRISGLPVKDGYKIVLSATTTTNESCSGEATFSVTANQITDVDLTLTCKKGGTDPVANGGVEVNADVKVETGSGTSACNGGYVAAAPYACPVGKPVSLTATPVTGAGTGISYSWTQNGTEFGTAADAATFNCDTAGDFTVKFTATGSDCSVEREIVVTCTGDVVDPVVCGDGKKEGDEECDDGNDVNEDACTKECKNNICGDGIKNEGVEACDDGNDVGGDGCENDCTKTPVVDPVVCGDGKKEGDEECDDGNDVNEDACTKECKNNICGDGIKNEGVEACDDGNDVGGDGCENDCTVTPDPVVCGDGKVEGDEECDDGNDVNEDACTKECKNNVCGDGFKNEGVEACDDGNSVDDDECSNECKVNKAETKWYAGPECDACMADKCADRETACYGDPECEALVKCEAEANCIDRNLGPLSCLCGLNVSVPECQGTPTVADFKGPCAAEIVAGLGTDTVGATFPPFSNPATFVGRAHQAFICMSRRCKAECTENIYND